MAQIFISYSHKNIKYLNELGRHLNFLQQNGMVSAWDDKQIQAGDRWFEKIQQALATAKIAILLVSADFLTSDFIREYELSPLLEAAQQEKVIICPVVVGSCLYELSSLRVYQSINSPEEPLEGMNFAQREVVWKQVAMYVFKLMQSFDE
jgi:internalin A